MRATLAAVDRGGRRATLEEADELPSTEEVDSRCRRGRRWATWVSVIRCVRSRPFRDRLDLVDIMDSVDLLMECL
ncbi:hypothetical protein ACLOJK_034501 [Asimina triloba]